VNFSVTIYLSFISLAIFYLDTRLLFALDCARCTNAMKTYSTSQAAKLIGVHVVTLHRWLASRKIRPSIGVPMNGRTLWRFTKADVAKFRRFKGKLKTGPKPKSRKK
jgi:excisionase family DNA binding protein